MKRKKQVQCPIQRFAPCTKCDNGIGVSTMTKFGWSYMCQACRSYFSTRETRLLKQKKKLDERKRIESIKQLQESENKRNRVRRGEAVFKVQEFCGLCHDRNWEIEVEHDAVECHNCGEGLEPAVYTLPIKPKCYRYGRS